MTFETQLYTLDAIIICFRMDSKFGSKLTVVEWGYGFYNWESKIFLFLGKLATVGISRSYIDNSDLEFSAIGRMKCTNPGTTGTSVDADLIIGLVSLEDIE